MTRTGEPPLPEVFTRELDREGLGALFADLSASASVREVRWKRDELGWSEAADGLDVVLDGLSLGAVRAVQIVYAWEEAVWVDTLLAQGEGAWRLVRMARPDAWGPPAPG